MVLSECEPSGPAIPGSAIYPDQRRVSSHLSGQRISLIPLDLADHTRDLFLNLSQPQHASIWKWMFWGPFSTFEEFEGYVKNVPHGHVPYVIMSSGPEHLSNQQPNHEVGTATPVGHIHFERIAENNRCIEIGSIILTPTAQRTTTSTEAVYLLLNHCFEDLGYLRVEWKCNALNAPSRAAAERLGFTFEAIFAKHMVIKGKGRDTAWHRITDEDWWQGGVKEALETWLAEENFDTDGRQKRRLRDIRMKISERGMVRMEARSREMSYVRATLARLRTMRPKVSKKGSTIVRRNIA